MLSKLMNSPSLILNQDSLSTDEESDFLRV